MIKRYKEGFVFICFHEPRNKGRRPEEELALMSLLAVPDTAPHT